MINKITLIVIVLSALPAVGVFAQEILTLEQAISLSLAHNYDIRMAQTDAEIADNNVSLGNAGFLPLVTASGSDTRSVVDSKQNYLSGNVIDRKGAESNSKSASVVLNWTIFDGFNMFVNNARLRELRHLGDLELKKQIENTVEQVIKNYYDLVQQKDRLNSLRGALKLSEERYKIVKSQYGFGSLSKLDLLNARVDLNSDSSAVLLQEVTLLTAKTTLNQLLARQSDLTFDTPDTIIVRDDLSLGSIQEGAKNANTDLMIAARSLHLARLDIHSVITERLPTVDFNAGYNINQSQSQSGFVNKNDTRGLTYGLTLNYPLFDGFNVNRRQQNAQLSWRNSQIEYDKVKSQIDADVTRAFQRYQNFLMQNKLEQQNTQAALEHQNIAFARYKVGTLTAIEWREAQLKYLDAVNRLIAAQYQAKLAETDLLKISGQLVRERP